MPVEETSISAALRNFTTDILNEVHTCMPGKIEKYDYTQQRAEVKTLLKRAMKSGAQLEYPIISDVPVCFPSGTDASITFPLNKGDFVLLFFSERSLNNWVNTGNDSNTELDKLHCLTDCIALPGIIPFSSTSKASNNEDVEISFKNQKITIKSNGDIEVGTGTLLSLVTETLVDAFNNHTHLCASPGSPSGTPGLSTPPISLGSAHLTSKVKAV
jgi:hypothetical protein